jgi:hypothetical protein
VQHTQTSGRAVGTRAASRTARTGPASRSPQSAIGTRQLQRRESTGQGPSLRVRRRRAVALLLSVAVVVLGLVAVAMSGGAALPAPPSTPFRARIVTAAESQLGYRTDPAHSYCNKFSAFWGAGTACGHGLRSEEWCADFAAWAWRMAGAQFTYSYTSGDINAASGSFYVWAVAHGTWHAVGSGYHPVPGDVAVYGLDPTTGTAEHVAVVIASIPGARGPDVVNGDGDRTGFSVVETGKDQYKADASGNVGLLAGYASPIPPTPAAKAPS